jgi:hypothetical protein
VAKLPPKSANDSPQLPRTVPKQKPATANSLAGLPPRRVQTIEAWSDNDEVGSTDESSPESVVELVRDLLWDVERHLCRDFKVFLAVMEEDPEPRRGKAKFRPKVKDGRPEIVERKVYGPIWTIDKNPEELYEDTKRRLDGVIQSLSAFPELRLAVCDLAGRMYSPPIHTGLRESIANVKIVLSGIEDKTVFDGPRTLKEWADLFVITPRGLTKKCDAHEKNYGEKIRRMRGKLCLLRRDIVKEWSKEGQRETDKTNRLSQPTNQR